jgi:hypothetical protein
VLAQVDLEQQHGMLFVFACSTDDSSSHLDSSQATSFKSGFIQASKICRYVYKHVEK